MESVLVVVGRLEEGSLRGVVKVDFGSFFFYYLALGRTSKCFLLIELLDRLRLWAPMSRISRAGVGEPSLVLDFDFRETFLLLLLSDLGMTQFFKLDSSFSLLSE